MEEENSEIHAQEIVESVTKPVAVKEGGDFIGKIRGNPWMLTSIVLGVVLLGVLLFGGIGYSTGSNENVVESDVAVEKLLGFIESQGQVGGDVNVVSVEKDGSLFHVTLSLQGQEIPVFISNDGKYLIADVIPLDPSLLPPGLGDAGSAGQQQGEFEPLNVEIGNSPIKGEENAPVTIVEFSDYQCPFCKKFYDETLPLLEKNYISSGKVKLVYKDFPLESIHPEAKKSAEAARCVGEQAGDKGYFEMHDTLFENQQSLNVDNYKKWARKIKGVNGDEFDTCLDSDSMAEWVGDNLVYGQYLGVTGTPAFFVNGKLLSGAQPYEVFETLIEAELSGDAVIGSSSGGGNGELEGI